VSTASIKVVIIQRRVIFGRSHRNVMYQRPLSNDGSIVEYRRGHRVVLSAKVNGCIAYSRQ
jgi:hypothetical protein